jgi:hypothetical protein
MNLKVGDEIELIISNVNNTNDLIKTIVKVVGILEKEIKCGEKGKMGCGIILGTKPYKEYYGLRLCLDCYKRESERRSKLTGHKPPDKFFGQVRK